MKKHLYIICALIILASVARIYAQSSAIIVYGNGDTTSSAQLTLQGGPSSPVFLCPDNFAVYPGGRLILGDSTSICDAEIFDRTALQVVEGGWNMVGVPMTVMDSSVLQLYPGSIVNTLFSFNSGNYQTETQLQRGRGYWLKFAAADTLLILGKKRDDGQIYLEKGWNLISGPSCDLPLSALHDPDSIVIPHTLYEFIGRYSPANDLLQGKAYWIKAATAGSITLSCSDTLAAVAALVRKKHDPDRSVTLRFSDASGVSGMLYFQSPLSEDREALELPPVPPFPLFDVRFSDHSAVTRSAAGLVLLQSTAFPIQVSMGNAGAGEVYELEEMYGEKVTASHRLGNGETLLMHNPAVRKLQIRRSGDVPLVAAQNRLAVQHYPNPFNPSTTISYSLPRRSEVDIAVFNLLGEKMLTLFAGIAEAGSHSLTWEGRDDSGRPVSSGIYFLRVAAADEFKVRRMLLQR